jgi:hypothetical protein
LLLVDARHGLKIGDKNYFKELLYGSTEDTSFLDDTLSGIFIIVIVVYFVVS